MSQIDISSPKHCAQKGLTVNKHRKKLFFSLSISFTLVLLLILLIRLILHPAKPDFSLTDANVFQLNLVSPTHLLNSSIQVTFLSKNPNQKVGIYYDEMQVYAAYKGQQITADTSLPPFYQGHNDKNLLTASLVGTGLPVAPSIAYEVGRDQMARRVVLNLQANGKLRWKVGTWVSGKYRFNVNCIAIMAFGPSVSAAPVVTSSQRTQCSTAL